MLSRLLWSLEFKICNGVRQSYLMRTGRPLSGTTSRVNHRVLWLDTRLYTSQVDTQKNEQITNVKKKVELAETKKINVKLKRSEYNRLFSLAGPEKWTLTS